ncbi:methyl-accepting chemotaxis protein [Roseibium sp.]|uniref:methyl-accepting chemotaxis protein n=1 Tax=Roseibium sp. TaxID=1936156 RepID=UPI003A96CD60
MEQVHEPVSAKRNRVFKLSVVVPVLMVGVTFASCVAVGIGGYVNARSGLEQAANSELSMVTEARKALLDMRLGGLAGDLSTTATGAAAGLAFTDMNAALASLEADRPKLMSYFNPEGSDAAQRAELSGKDNKTMYAWRHTDVHNSFYSSWKNNHYGDIYAINKDGVVIYSVTKSGDFLENVKDGPLKDTGLGEVYAKAIEAEKGAQFYSEFARYDAAGGTSSMFVAQPAYITSFSGEELGGVIVVRIGNEFLEEVANDRKGLGETGQVYLVDEKGTLITNQPLSSEPTALVKTISGDVISGALAGNISKGALVDADGVAKLAVAAPLTFGSDHWAIVAERSVDEAMASVAEMRNSMIVSTLITVAIAAVIALFFSRSITRPLVALVHALEEIAQGDTSADIKAAERGDEIGDIGRAVVQIRQNSAQEQEQRAAEDARQAESQTAQRKQMLADLASEFEASVGKVVDHVAHSAATLRESAAGMREMTITSGETSQRAAQVSAEAMEEVQSIATASDQLSSSIQEISSLIERSSAVAQTATVRAESTNGTVKSLAEAANRIGEVITLISDIADQTNLLALNATIEAARAGEAGKGFAVVASEVKELASQTGKATGEIQQQIDAIRQATDDAVGAIGDIQDTINEITQSVTDVSAAVTEQSFATRGIAENTQRAAVGTSKVSEDISNVSEISEKTSDAATSFTTSVEELSEQANHLDTEVKNFLSQVRSA